MKNRKIALFLIIFALIWSSVDFVFSDFNFSSVAVAKTKKTTRPKKTRKIKVKKAAFSLPVKIIGDAGCIEQVQAAFGLLGKYADVHYGSAIKYIGAVECAASGSGMYVKENPPRYQVGQATIAAGTLWLAGTIAHEACHAKLYRDYLDAHSAAAVPAEIYSGQAAEKQCLDVQYDALKKVGADRSTLDYVKNISDTQYWNVSYVDRWW